MDRRQFVQTATATSLFYTTAGVFAEQLQPSAQMGEGPFYPDRLPLDTDNDLLILNDNFTPAAGPCPSASSQVISRRTTRR